MRQVVAADAREVHDSSAATLQPAIVPAVEDVQQPLEAQGRGFAHGHSKGHSRVGTGLRWVGHLLGNSVRRLLPV